MSEWPPFFLEEVSARFHVSAILGLTGAMPTVGVLFYIKICKKDGGSWMPCACFLYSIIFCMLVLKVASRMTLVWFVRNYIDLTQQLVPL